MKTKQLILPLMAIMMVCAPFASEANTVSDTKLENTISIHPRKGRIARWKANRIKRQVVKREIKRRWFRPRHRGITIVL